MNKRFAIFDMDGTLVDSMAFWQRLGREFLASQNITERVDEVLERIIPMTMIESAALFIQEFGLSRTQEDLAAEMNAIMERHYRSDIPLKPGVPEYLNMLRSNGVKMCVASATPVHLIRACLTRLGVAEYFSFLISCDEAGAGKDRPGVYLLASEKLEAAPQESAVYEDALYAAKTAKKAGFYTIGVYDKCAAENWEALKALSDETIRDWKEPVNQYNNK